MEQANTQETKENFIIKYFNDFKVLKETRREYWGIQIINALDCLAYFAMFNIILVTLSKDFGYDDVGAGQVFLVFSSLTTIFLFISGMFTDWLGIKRALYVAMFGLIITRIGMLIGANMSAGTLRHVVVVGSLGLMAPFMAMVQTAFQASNRRFTTKKSRGAGFNLWYLFMNVGAAGGGFIIDIIYLKLHLPHYHVFTLGLFTGILCMITIFTMIKRTEQLRDPEEEDDKEEDEEGQEKKEPVRQNPIQIIRSVIKESAFWRFVVLITLLLGVRCVFLYLSLIYPKMWYRVIGPDATVGALQAFNPIMVIIGLILFIPLLHRFHVYNMLVYGALITSISMLICAIPAPAGINIVEFTYWSTLVFLVVLTVGELIWSPRLQEYTAAIAPEGQEGTYLGLSMVPYFLAKMVISAVSGYLLIRWCAESPDGMPIVGERIWAGEIPYLDSPYMMMLVLASVAVVGTIAAIVGKSWFIKGAQFGK